MQKMLATDGLESSSTIRFDCGRLMGGKKSHMSSSSGSPAVVLGRAKRTGAASISSIGGRLHGIARLLLLGVVLQIPCLGLFIWPFAVAGVGFKYLRINFLGRFNTP